VELITEAEAAKIIHQEQSTLPVWRAQRRGPAYFKIGRKVFYSRADLAAWITSRRIEPKGRAR
jgi:Helix-turn-helix domain